MKNSAKIFFLLGSNIILSLYSFSQQPLETGWYPIMERDTVRTIKMTAATTGKTYNVFPKPIVTEKNFNSVELVSNSNPRLDGLKITLDKEGADKWNLCTRESINLYLAFVVNNKLECVWYCDHQSSDGIIYVTKEQISKGRLKELKKILKTTDKSPISTKPEIGMWIAERHGLSDSILFNENGIITFYYDGIAMGGQNFEYGGKRMKQVYKMDYIKTPYWIDINIIDLNSNKLIEKTKGIILFLSDDKIMYRTPFDKNAKRPTKFDYSENKAGETMIYTRRK